MSRRLPWALQIAALACLVGACSEPAPEPALPAQADAAVAAKASKPARARPADDTAGLPLPSGETLWGVSIPTGCIPQAVRRDWIRFRCTPTVGTLERYFRFRFPAARISMKGTGVQVIPGVDRAGLARIQQVYDGPSRARLTVFRRGASLQDPIAVKLFKAHNPEALKAPSEPLAGGALH